MKPLILSALLFITSIGFGQTRDLIITKDSTTYIGTVQQIRDSVIRFEHANGSIQKIRQGDVIYMKLAKDVQVTTSDTPEKLSLESLYRMQVESNRNMEVAGNHFIAAGTCLGVGLGFAGIAAGLTALNKTSEPATIGTLAGFSVAFSVTGIIELIVGGSKLGKSRKR